MYPGTTRKHKCIKYGLIPLNYAIKQGLDSFQATIELPFCLFPFNQRTFPFLKITSLEIENKKNINIYKTYRNLRLQIMAKKAIQQYATEHLFKMNIKVLGRV